MKILSQYQYQEPVPSISDFMPAEHEHENESPKILIEGIGNIGGVLASVFQKNGYSVTLVTNNSGITNSIRAGGLRFRNPDSAYTIKTSSVYTSVAEINSSKQFDLVYLAMKAPNVIEAVKQSQSNQILAPNGCYITLQNGFVVDAVAKMVGVDKVIGALVGWSGTMAAPGVYHQTGFGKTILGLMENGRNDLQLFASSKPLEHIADINISYNVLGLMWSNLAANCMNPISAISGKTLGELVKDKIARNLFLKVHAETVDTAAALHVRLEPIKSNPRLMYVDDQANWVKRTVKYSLLKFFDRKFKFVKSSMLCSLEREKPTEVDWLSGYVIEKAGAAGVDVPVNTVVRDMVKQIENDDRKISTKNLKELQYYLKL